MRFQSAADPIAAGRELNVQLVLDGLIRRAGTRMRVSVQLLDVNAGTTHILATAQIETAVRAALKQAHAYVAHDWLCDPTGFALVVNQGQRQVGVMGDEIKFSKGLQLRIAAPMTGTIRLLRNGELLQPVNAADCVYPLTEPGTYRAEVWLTLDGELRPWIYANPIRVLTATR